ncbi:MAG: hypothetical protein Q7J98_00855, partial [Kiritimatiellia bacterium]|nr:hypothetical protein [Kiritimatiellia bacterium]
MSIFGHNAEEKIVAAEVACGGDASAPCQAVLYFRQDRQITRRTESFLPFMVIEDERLLNGLTGKHSFQPLSGKSPLKVQVSFNSWAEWARAKKWLLDKTRISIGVPNAPFIILNDPVHQYLLFSGRTLFKGMNFDDVRRMQVDIE